LFFNNQTIRGELFLPSKPSTFGLPSTELTAKLNAVINKDYEDRKRQTKSLDDQLTKKLHMVCAKDVDDPFEVVCILRRFLTCRYGMELEAIDLSLRSAEILASESTNEMELAV
jgi:hypothetical protein